MNQILYTGGKNKKGGAIDTKKILIFFIVLLIIFAICIIGVGINLLGKVKAPDNNIANGTTDGTANNVVNNTPDTPIKSNIKVSFESQVGGVKALITSDLKIETV